MAIYHLSAKMISRGAGKNAVHSAAYRHGTAMKDELRGERFDYSRKSEAVYSDVALPDETPAWLRNLIDGRDVHGVSEAIWNSVERATTHQSGQLARDFELALPVELTRSQNIALVEDFANVFTARGMIADWSYHDAPGNPHVHMMTSLRPLTEAGWGPKTTPVLDSHGDVMRYPPKIPGAKGQPMTEEWAGSREDLKDWRAGWAACVNKHLALAGHDVTVDHRSFREQGIDLAPGSHIGRYPTVLLDKGEESYHAADVQDVGLENTRRLKADPSRLLAHVSSQRAVFTEGDLYRSLKQLGVRGDDQADLARKALSSDKVVRLEDGPPSKAKYATRDMIALERGMCRTVYALAERSNHRVPPNVLINTLSKYDFLSSEQKAAVVAMTMKGADAVAIKGAAGAGKSTLLKAAQDIWRASGYQVRGVALAGKAADELAKSSGIESRTLASLDYRLTQNLDRLTSKDIVVLDEAGMVGSREMERLVSHVAAAGAKLVMVGDPDQLPAITAGAAFRAIIDEIGSTDVTEIRRQSVDWQRSASMEAATGNVFAAVNVYNTHGRIHEHATRPDTITAMGQALASDIRTGLNVLGLAQTNADVDALNAAVRIELKAAGQLDHETLIETSRGEKAFAKGDSLLFLSNDAKLGVKNGTRGEVLKAGSDMMVVKTEAGNRLAFDPSDYNSITHGYAVTVHKSQGATVDKVHLLATSLMRAPLAYVGMTRHRDDLAIHYAREDVKRGIEGLARMLARPDEKATTRDYDTDAVMAYGERRGLDPLGMMLKVAKAVGGFIVQVAAYKPPVKEPIDLNYPPFTQFPKTIEQMIDAIPLGEAYHKRQQTIAGILDELGHQGEHLSGRLIHELRFEPERFNQRVDQLTHVPVIREKKHVFKANEPIYADARPYKRLQGALEELRDSYARVYKDAYDMLSKERSELQIGIEFPDDLVMKLFRLAADHVDRPDEFVKRIQDEKFKPALVRVIKDRIFDVYKQSVRLDGLANKHGLPDTKRTSIKVEKFVASVHLACKNALPIVEKIEATQKALELAEKAVEQALEEKNQGNWLVM